jgi:hypothetical protein
VKTSDVECDSDKSLPVWKTSTIRIGALVFGISSIKFVDLGLTKTFLKEKRVTPSGTLYILGGVFGAIFSKCAWDSTQPNSYLAKNSNEIKSPGNSL